MEHIKAQCREFQEKFPQLDTITTVWAIPPNVRVYQTSGDKGVLHTHGVLCKRATYKSVHRLYITHHVCEGEAG
jgi:hypothetical protein